MQKQRVNIVVYDPSNQNRQLMAHSAEAVIYRRGDDPKKRTTSTYYEPVGLYYVRCGPFWIKVKLVKSEFLLEITVRNFLRAFLPHLSLEKFLDVCTSQPEQAEANS